MTETAERARLDLRFVDGLRAVAALSVAVFHAYTFTGMTGESSRELTGPFRVVLLGDFAVPLFIVLSGFVLMLPIARNPGLVISRGNLSYFKRRARRILPPYYASLAFFLVLIATVPLLHSERGTAWDSKIPVTAGGLISHLTLFHNLSKDWIYQINGPAWSVATEWQLYFALPFLLLPLWRRIGMIPTLLIAVTIGWVVHFAAPRLDGAHYWFLGLFALGMASAFVLVKDTKIPALGPVLAASAAIFAVGAVVFEEQAHVEAWLAETVFGGICALLLVWMGRRTITGRSSVLHRILEHRLLVWLGLWSYSIYLIHSPLLGLGNVVLLETTDMPIGAHFAVMLFVVLPAALTVAYVFHRLVERRFLTSHQQSADKP